MPRARRHYAWTVLGLCFGAILCAQGVRLSFGAFVRPWQETFDASRGTITLIGSLSFLVYGGSQPFVGSIRRSSRYSGVEVASMMPTAVPSGLISFDRIRMSASSGWQ